MIRLVRNSWTGRLNINVVSRITLVALYKEATFLGIDLAITLS